MITSTHNPKIQWVRSLQSQAKARREENAFPVEGVRLLEEALASSFEPLLLLHTEEISDRARSLVASALERGIPTESVSPQVLKAAADTESPQGLVAVIRLGSLPLPADPDFLLILDEVRDPGNLGTLLRTAAAAGVQAVLCSAGTVDPFSPKVLRAGMGAHFRLPIRVLGWGEMGEVIHASPGMKVYLADMDRGDAYSQANFKDPVAILIGSEAEGASSNARSLSDAYVHIPMPGKAESLNAAVAGAVLMFEVVRQRSGIGE